MFIAASPMAGAKAVAALAGGLKSGRIKNNPADRSNNSTDFDVFKRLFLAQMVRAPGIIPAIGRAAAPAGNH
jgi:hypothetical protein